MSAPAPSMFTPAAKAMAEKLGLTMGRANLEEFAATLEELAKANPNIVAVTSDSRGSGKLAPFGKALPGRIVEVGIAEQNLVGITVGISSGVSFGNDVAFIGVMNNGLVLLEASPFWQQVIKGLVILVAVAVDKMGGKNI